MKNFLTLKKLLATGSGLALLSSAGLAPVAGASFNKVPAGNFGASVYRVYNPNSGEHFYTKSAYERDHLTKLGWHDEGVGWYAPFEGGADVYRLYNPNAGDHYYTASSYERDFLVKEGWNYEGVGWTSGGKVPVYVAYNPNAVAGAHNYTTGIYEQNHLLSIGWKYGSKAWQAVAEGTHSFGKAELPERSADAPEIALDLDKVIDSFQQMVLAKGPVPIGSRVIVSKAGVTDGVYKPGDKVAVTSGKNVQSVSLEDLIPGAYASSFGEGGTVTAVLTAKGWFLLPDVQTDFDGEVKTPDLAAFIASGDPADFTSYTDGTPLVFGADDQFGAPVLIS